MINFRNIFNPSYNYIGLIIIALIALIIIIINKDIKNSIYQICTCFLIAGIILLVINLILNFITGFLIINSYKIFIQRIVCLLKGRREILCLSLSPDLKDG